MKKTRKLLAIFLAIILVSMPVSAAEISSPEETTTATPTTIVCEDFSLREQNAKHFKLSDGSYTAVVYDKPVHYLQENTWTEIDNSLVSASLLGAPLTGTVKRDSELTTDDRQSISQYVRNPALSYSTAYYENNANDFNVHLPKEINSGMPIVVSYQEHSLRFCFNDIEKVVAEVVHPVDDTENGQVFIDQSSGNDLQARLEKDPAVTVEKNASAISYSSIGNNIDLNYHIFGETLKEDIVFNSLPEAESFSYDFVYTGLTAILQENKSVSFADENGESIFTIAAPAMFDSDEGYSTDISVTLEQTDSGCRYTVTPNRTWLEDSERVYPITLDPQISTTQNSSYIHDNGVQQSDPNTNYITSDRMYVGSGPSSTQGRIYFKLTQWPSVAGLDANTITGASLSFNYYPVSSYQTA